MMRRHDPGMRRGDPGAPRPLRTLLPIDAYTSLSSGVCYRALPMRLAHIFRCRAEAPCLPDLGFRLVGFPSPQQPCQYSGPTFTVVRVGAHS